MAYLTLIKSFIEFGWKYKTLFLFLTLIVTLYFGYKYVSVLNNELNDTKEIADTAIKEHNKMINNYNIINEELKVYEIESDKLEKNNRTLKNKLSIAAGGKNESWGNTPIPDSVRLLLQKRSQEP